MPIPDGFPPMDYATYASGPWFEPFEPTELDDDWDEQDEAYREGKAFYAQGRERTEGRRLYHGKALSEFERGWDDAEEDASDATFPDIVLPVVALWK